MQQPAPHHLFQVPRHRLDPFFERVPRLWAAAQAPVAEAYQACLYRTEHEFGPADLRRIDAAWGLPTPDWGTVDPHKVIRTLDAMAYPDTSGLGRIEAVPGLTLRTASHYLHFFHHTFPIYSKATLRGLAALGIDIPWTPVRDVTLYGLYVQAIEELRDRIPFWCVPEANVHLNRILQAALEKWPEAP